MIARNPLTVRAFILVCLSSETSALAPSEIAEEWRDRYDEDLYDGRLYRAISACKRAGHIARYVRDPNSGQRQIVYGLTELGKKEAAIILLELHALAVGD
jgi:DNA-binding PadR family transcriptional regulator